MMVQAKRIYIFTIKVNKLFFFLSTLYFLKEIDNMFSVFLSSYRDTCESLGEFEKLQKYAPNGLSSHAFLILQNFHSDMSLLNNWIMSSRI